MEENERNLSCSKSSYTLQIRLSPGYNSNRITFYNLLSQFVDSIHQRRPIKIFLEYIVCIIRVYLLAMLKCSNFEVTSYCCLYCKSVEIIIHDCCHICLHRTFNDRTIVCCFICSRYYLYQYVITSLFYAIGTY